MANQQLALAALADPMRSAIIEHLAERPMAVNELAARLPITRPAVSQHLKLLKQASLVDVNAEGTRRVYRLDPAGLAALRGWLDRFWDRSLQSFAEFAGRDEKR